MNTKELSQGVVNKEIPNILQTFIKNLSLGVMGASQLDLKLTYDLKELQVVQWLLLSPHSERVSG